MDASFRLQTDKFQPVFDLAIANGGMVQFYVSPHSMFAATDPRMWDFLVTDPVKLMNTTMYGSNSMLMYKTEKAYKGVLYWWFMCALDQDCIAPLWSSNLCKRWHDMRTVRVEQCHRQDQSSLGTLIANLYDFNVTKYVPKNSKSFVNLCKLSTIRLLNASICSDSSHFGGVTRLPKAL